MKRRVYPYSIALAMAMMSGGNRYFDIPRTLTPEQKRRRDEYLRERNHRLNPVDLSEREFIVKGERIMAHDRKTALKKYAIRHPESKKRKK